MRLFACVAAKVTSFYEKSILRLTDFNLLLFYFSKFFDEIGFCVYRDTLTDGRESGGQYAS